MMLEADVRLYKEGTESVNESLPVMAHDILDASTSNLTLADFLHQARNPFQLLRSYDKLIVQSA